MRDQNGDEYVENRSFGDAALVQLVTEHVRRHVGEIMIVWHEEVSDYVHVDLHVVAPTPPQPFYTVVTSGMAERPMDVGGVVEPETWRFAELVLCLPPEWPMEEAQLKEPENWWPLRSLFSLVHYPHRHGTWLGPGHTVAESRPMGDTAFTAWFLTWPKTLPESFHRLEGSDDVINFYAAIPIYAEELEIARRAGGHELDRKFSTAGLTELIEPHRPPIGP